MDGRVGSFVYEEHINSFMESIGSNDVLYPDTLKIESEFYELFEERPRKRRCTSHSKETIDI